MKILVTGGAGFIGSHVVERLVENGNDVFVMDNLFSGRKENVNKDAIFIKGDVRDGKEVREIISKISPEIIVHMAATVSPQRSAKKPILDARINIEGTLNLYSAMSKIVNNPLKKIVVASSQATYGEGLCFCEGCKKEVKPKFRKPEDLWNRKFEHYCPFCNYYPLKPIPTPESTEQIPSMPYGVSKLAEEKYLLAFAQCYGIDGIALRYFNVYGPRQSSQGMETAVSAIFFHQILNLKKSPIVFEDGKQIRDFVFVSDVADVTFLAVKKMEGIRIYNIGCEPICIGELAERIIDVLKSNLKPNITFEPRYVVKYKGSIDTRHCFADMDLIKNEWDWKPKIGLEEGLEITADWAKKNREELI